MSRKKQLPLAVELKNVTKTYILHHEKPTFIENVIKNGRQEQFVALKNIDLKIFKGEKVGIIGANGSGKTTLLKIIAGITNADSGQVKTRGKVISLIDLGAGFHPDLTGEENIFLNGLIIGMSKQEIEQQFNNIIKFADIGRFIDAPLYTYSDGMKLRLGFSIAVHAKPDILILDEAITTGDEGFRKKSGQKINQFFQQKKTILIVSHWLDYLKQYVDRIVWLDQGKIVDDNELLVLDRYLKKINRF